MALITPRRKTPTAKSTLANRFADRLLWQKKPPRYRDAKTGRYLTPAAVRQTIDDEIDAGIKRLRKHGEDASAGRITDINVLYDRLAADVKLLHLMSYASAKGGFANMTAADYANVSKTVRRQFRYLHRFMKEIEANPAKASGGYFLNRISLYAEGARESYEEARRQLHKDLAYAWERTVLHSRESCTAKKGRKGCTELAALMWVPIGTSPAIGHRACFSRCKCTFEYAITKPD